LSGAQTRECVRRWGAARAGPQKAQRALRVQSPRQRRRRRRRRRWWWWWCSCAARRASRRAAEVGSEARPPAQGSRLARLLRPRRRCKWRASLPCAGCRRESRVADCRPRAARLWPPTETAPHPPPPCGGQRLTPPAPRAQTRAALRRQHPRRPRPRRPRRPHRDPSRGPVLRQRPKSQRLRSQHAAAAVPCAPAAAPAAGRQPPPPLAPPHPAPPPVPPPPLRAP
jgi:hypothetical protein